MNFKEEVESLSEEATVKFLDVIVMDQINNIKNSIWDSELIEIFEKALKEAEVVVDRWVKEGEDAP